MQPRFRDFRTYNRTGTQRTSGTTMASGTEMKLRQARGPLKTGTYVAHGVTKPGQYHALHNSTKKLELTDKGEHEGIKVTFDSLETLNLTSIRCSGKLRVWVIIGTRPETRSITSPRRLLRTIRQ